jgi:hypothetical protein
MSDKNQRLSEYEQKIKKLESENDALEKALEGAKHARVQLYLSYATGVIFVGILLYLALSVENPTDWQYTLFRTILSLGAAGIAALLPGDLEIRYKNLLRSTGALAVFIFVFSVNPAKLAGIPEPTPTESYSFKILTVVDADPALNCFTLPFSDVRKIEDMDRLRSILKSFVEEYANLKFTFSDYEIYRSMDETKVSKVGDLTSKNNGGIVVLDKKFIAENGEHTAFTMVHNMSCR